jgi:Raf kinase inhibitor-like YbhB/YbcL family protein
MNAVALICAALLWLAQAGCEEEKVTYPSFRVASLAFGEGEVIPNLHTCHGAGKSPPLSFSRVPDEAKGLVVIMEDLDYLTGPHTQWMVWGLPAAIILPEDIDENLPEGAVQGTADDAKGPGYEPPCPPDDYHRFSFKAYAVDKMIRLEEGATRKQLDEAMKDHIVGLGELTGRVPPKKL